MVNGPLPAQLQALWHALQAFFKSSFVDGLAGVFKAVGVIANEIGYLVGAIFSLSELYFLIKEKNLKFRQKIIPFLGSALACAFQLAIVVILCAAVAVLLPPFFLVASALNVFRNIGFYIRERAERSNLRALFKDEKRWYAEIETLDLTPRLRMEFKRLLHREHFDKQDVHSLYIRLANHVVNQNTKDKQALQILLDKFRKGAYLPHEKSALESQIKGYQKKIKREFKAHYKPLFRLIKRKQRLHYLEKNLNSRLKTVGLSIGLMLVSAAVCGVSIAAPPAAPFIFAGLGVLTAGLSIPATFISMKLWLRSRKGEKKVGDLKYKIRDAIVPQISINVSPKEKEKIGKNLIFSSIQVPVSPKPDDVPSPPSSSPHSSPRSP